LDLPVKLNFIRDVKVEGEVQKVTYTFVVHWVKTFEDDDWGWFDGFWGVKGSVAAKVKDYTKRKEVSE
jgi:hypothetical protein